MKKILGIVPILILLTAVSSFGLMGIGISSGLDPIDSDGVSPGASLTFEVPEVAPFLIGIGVSGIGSDNLQAGITVDKWFYKDSLTGVLRYYVGLGGYIAFPNQFGFGARLPVGLQIWPIDPLELFLEVAPSIGIGEDIPDPGLQASIGFRFWF